jgi:hypothetical protein
MKSAHLFLRITIVLPLMACGLRAETTAPPPVVSIIADSLIGQPAQHGIDKIIAALKDKQVSFEAVNTLDDAKGKMLIVAGLATNQLFSAEAFKEFGQSVPTNAEALAIQKLDYKGKPAWAIAGSDERGLMYAELDVADRIRWSTNTDSPLSDVRDTLEKPGVGNRGITLFAMNRAYWESRFYDETYWARYLDTLAQNRFNSMVVILGYENGGFLAPCYPYFFDVPEFPEVRMIGITAAQQQQNVEALNRLIAMAHARGINFTIGIWDHIYRGNAGQRRIARTDAKPGLGDKRNEPDSLYTGRAENISENFPGARRNPVSDARRIGLEIQRTGEILEIHF